MKTRRPVGWAWLSESRFPGSTTGGRPHPPGMKPIGARFCRWMVLLGELFIFSRPMGIVVVELCFLRPHWNGLFKNEGLFYGWMSG